MVQRNGKKYDDWGWHLDGAVQAGQPEEHALVHIAAYFAWIVRRGWYNPELYGPDELRPVQQGEPGAATHLMEMSDGKLVNEEMTDEAERFSDYYYADGYLADWASEFSDSGYGVADVPTTHERIQRLLDQRYDRWVQSGRPSKWSPPLSSRLRALRRTILAYAVLFGTIAAVAIISVMLNLRGFPWPLVQLAVVGTVLVVLIRRELF